LEKKLDRYQHLPICILTYELLIALTKSLREFSREYKKIVDCVSSREDGSTLIKGKVLQIAKRKVCHEDLKGTLNSNGVCNWTQTVNYVYVTIQL